LHRSQLHAPSRPSGQASASRCSSAAVSPDVPNPTTSETSRLYMSLHGVAVSSPAIPRPHHRKAWGQIKPHAPMSPALSSLVRPMPGCLLPYRRPGSIQPGDLTELTGREYALPRTDVWPVSRSAPARVGNAARDHHDHGGSDRIPRGGSGARVGAPRSGDVDPWRQAGGPESRFGGARRTGLRSCPVNSPGA
jgi:hypothetical protein